LKEKKNEVKKREDEFKYRLNKEQAKTDEFEKRINKFEQRIDNILHFNPQQFLKEIENSRNNILDIKRIIDKDNTLSSLSSPLDSIDKKFESLSNVVKSYEDVYINIISPVMQESKKASKQTVKWAIISIILSSIISGVISVFITFFIK
jgi:chromosome segregation ATPase